MRTLKRILVFLTFIFIIGYLLMDNIIFIRYLNGNARNLGKPLNAKIYTDGKFNNNIEVYKINKYWNGKNANYYLINFLNLDGKILSANLDYNYVGIPSSTNKNDYRKILGNLIQTEVGGHFTTIDNKIKGLDFNPEFQHSKNQIKFLLPKSEYGIDSLRIEL